MTKNLITFSGGADSALLVHKLITETSDENTLLVLCNENLKWSLSTKKLLAIQPVLAELKTYGNFEVVYHNVEVDQINSMMDDMWYAYAIKKFASKLNDGTYDRLVSAVGFEQNNGKFMKNREQRGVRPTFEANHLFDAAVTQGQFWQPFVTNDFFNNYNRWYLYKNLPESLMNKSMSCMTYSNPACGLCGKCLYNQKVIECIADGWTASDLQEWTEERSRYYGGANRDAPIIYWIHAETGVGRNFKCGVSKDDRKGDFIFVKDKNSFVEWYDTIEYTVPTDNGLIDWKLSKSDWSPPTQS